MSELLFEQLESVISPMLPLLEERELLDNLLLVEVLQGNLNLDLLAFQQQPLKEHQVEFSIRIRLVEAIGSLNEQFSSLVWLLAYESTIRGK